MKNKLITLLAALVASTAAASAQSGPEDIIPVPVDYELSGGTVASGFQVKERIGKRFLRKVSEYNLTDWQEKSAYSIEISEKGARIEAADEQGAFYARQTLGMLQSLSPEVKCCTILDWPRFQHRGLMIDVSRNYQPKDFILKQLDMISKLKLNRFHFHLVDQAGWRIQIDKYPLLHQFAAWRPQAEFWDWTKESQFCYWNDPRAYGGYFTKEDIREIVAYAAERHIEVIPEIEMPGHSYEAISAYPQLACKDAEGNFIKGDGELCPGNEFVFTFLQDVLAEVFELFPSKYVHIGGDEAGKVHWHDCPACKERMEKEHLGSVEELQSYLIKRMEKFANDNGKTIIGWDEILEGGLAPNATVMSWRGTEGGHKAIAEGHDVIMSPTTYFYLDYHQGKDQYRAVGPYLPLEKSYSYEPLDEGIAPENAHHLLGVQANMWTEYVHTAAHQEIMIYPRIFAISEIGWSQSGDKDYARFRRNAIAWMKVMDALGYAHYDLENEVKE